MARQSNYKTEAILQLAQAIRIAGYRAFIAERGTHGFYTDAEGSKVVSFQYDLGGMKYHGNYRSKRSGTGWGLKEGPLGYMFDQTPPSWGTGTEKVQQVTLAQYLETYQSSSRFTEFGLSETQE